VRAALTPTVSGMVGFWCPVNRATQCARHSQCRGLDDRGVADVVSTNDTASEPSPKASGPEGMLRAGTALS
jgi:hypothetical protein